MNMVSTVGMRRCDALVDTLKAEFGGILAERILETEAADFLWEARIKERYLGEQTRCEFDGDDGSPQLSRIVILSSLNVRWHAAMCLVNGDGNAEELLWKQSFDGRVEAEISFLQAR